MKTCLMLLIACCSFAVDAHSQGYNTIFVSYSPHVYFNKANVENDGRGFDPISARNTIGQNAGLEFERTTKDGILLTGGLFYGSQTHDILIDADFTNFDLERAAENLNGVHFRRRIFLKNDYLFPRILIGYKRNVGTFYAISLKGGVGIKLFSSGEETLNFYAMQYTSDDKSTIINSVFGRERMSIDNSSGQAFRKRIRTIDLHIGLQRKIIDCKFIKTIRIGIELSSAWPNAEDIDRISVSTNDNPNAPFSNISTDYYFNKHRSVGLRISFGF